MAGGEQIAPTDTRAWSTFYCLYFALLASALCCLAFPLFPNTRDEKNGRKAYAISAAIPCTCAAIYLGYLFESYALGFALIPVLWIVATRIPILLNKLIGKKFKRPVASYFVSTFIWMMALSCLVVNIPVNTYMESQGKAIPCDSVPDEYKPTIEVVGSGVPDYD